MLFLLYYSASFIIYVPLVTDLHLAHDKIFRMISLNLFFVVWTNLINSNVFYRNNHKCNIYNFCRTTIKTIQFFSRIQKVAKILCIIKKYIKFENYFF